jgi:acylphosphatase
MSSIKHVEITITGQVQGVFFRQSAKDVADDLGLTGFVKNEPDGSVKIVAEGTEDSLQKLADWARVGTENARIENVDVSWQEYTGTFQGFQIQQ